MTRIIDPSSKRRLTAPLALGLALSALLALGSFATSASADERDHRDRGHEHGYHHPGWTGGYYAPPPVIYGEPGYYPPPVVYGPGVGISLPGVNIGIR
jgi:hypothetical protein